jgi:predicted DNA-binding transcriptional regulator AlpA
MNKPSFTIPEFCTNHGNISKSFFHKLVNEGKAPRLMKIGRRTLISAEAASEWRALMEAQTIQTNQEV